MPAPPSVAPRALGRLLGLLLPAPCLACGRPLAAARVPLGLCEPCRGRLRPLAGRPGTCPGCARELPGLPSHGPLRGGSSGARNAPGPLCGRCLARPPAWERLHALWRYEPPLDAVILALKFRRLDYLGEHLAAEAAESLAGAPLVDAALVDAGLDLAVPVPLHWRRRLARGYNQAERIARPLARRLAIPCANALTRPRAGPPQTALGRAARLANARGVFRVLQPPTVAGRRVLLVDDVATTGATLEAAARALRQAGAAAVLALVAGRTPDPE